MARSRPPSVVSAIPGPTLERGELLAPLGQPLGLARDLLGVDRVRADLRPEGGLGGTRRVERSPWAVLTSASKPAPRAGLAGGRVEGGEHRGGRGRFLGRSVPVRGERLDRLAPDEPLEPGVELVDRGDMCLLTGKQVLGRREVGQPEPLELGRAVVLRLAKLGLHL